MNEAWSTVLLSRPDRLGDVVLSLPAMREARRLAEAASSQRVWLGVVVDRKVAPLLEGMPGVDEVIPVDFTSKESVRSLDLRIQKSGCGQPWQSVIALQNHFGLAWRFFRWIPHRVGPRGPLWSAFLYNDGVRQRRSLVQKHEAEYGIDLVKVWASKSLHSEKPNRGTSDLLAISQRSVEKGAPDFSIHLSEKEKGQARAELIARGLDLNRPIVVIHPGMGGSALNWPESHYRELAVGLLTEHLLNEAGVKSSALSRETRIQVLVTGGPSEKGLVARVADSVPEIRTWVAPLDETSLRRFAAILSLVDVVVAPSTGPLHLASHLGRKVIGLYPPLRVQSVRRWGPYPANTGSRVLTPEVVCPEVFQCAGSVCSFYPCMERISVAKVGESVRALLNS